MQDFGKLLLRLAVGGLMIFHGVAKITHGIGWLDPMLQAKGLPVQIAYGVYIGELLGPLMVVLGFWSRLGALAIVVDMIAATFLVKSADVLAINPKSGGWAVELEAFYLICALAVMCLGSGRFSLTRGTGKLD